MHSIRLPISQRNLPAGSSRTTEAGRRVDWAGSATEGPSAEGSRALRKARETPGLQKTCFDHAVRVECEMKNTQQVITDLLENSSILGILVFVHFKNWCGLTVK